MRRTLIRWGAVAALGLAWPGAPGARAGAPAETPEAPDTIDFAPAVRLERARVCLRVTDLACAAVELSAARAGAADLDDAGRVELERLTAEVALARGDDRGAAAALDALLARSPAWAPAPEAATPALGDALGAARRRADHAPPELTVSAPGARVPAGKALRLDVAAADPSGVARVVLHVAVADGTVVDLAMGADAGGRFRAAVPAELVVVPEVRLWIEAWDGVGNGPARWGEPGAPQRVAVTPTDSGGVTSRWWFWTAVGAGAVATGVMLAVLLSSGGGQGGGNEVGGVQIVPEFP